MRRAKARHDRLFGRYYRRAGGALARIGIMHPRFAGLWLIFSVVLLSSAVLAQSCRGDIVSYPPSVSIVAPSTMPITGSAIFAASCADPVGCKRIVFAVDGVTIATIKAEPFTVSFDTTVLLDVNNPHTLTATATNTFGLPATTRASFTTNNGTTPAARTFYIATNGKDANPGTAAQPWATPNHALRCGDTIVLQPGTYTNPFANWGHVWSCPSASGYYFANLVCNGPYVQSCLFTNSVAGTSIMVVNSSNWLVRGVTAVNNVQYGGCFGGWTAGVAYIAFVNVYAKNCGAGTGTSGQDYVAYVGSLFYGGAGLGGQCFSNLSIFQPKNFDSQSGTHVFIGGSFFINASNSLNCTDGEGLIFDRWDINHYTGQGVVEQSLFIGNCSEAWEVLGSYGGPLYFTQSTTWSNGKTCNSGSGGGSEILLSFTGSGCCVTIDRDIAVGTAASVGLWNGKTLVNYPFYTVLNSFFSRVTLSNSYIWNSAAPQYVQAKDGQFPPTQTNITNADPGFASPTPVTTAPDCSTAATVLACVAAIRANFVPSGRAAAFGYQPPGACSPDPLYPAWLKGAIPDGLLTKPCGY